MFFLMECRHHPGKDAERDRLRSAHRDWVRTGGNGLASVLVGSALWDAAGQAVGHWGILEADTLQTAHAFAEGDPFAAEGVVDETRLTRLADTFQAHRIAERLTQP
ncbi:YciI family protein [Maritimibacter sp. HL-12]|jgi:uncharacterized protein|uniref:YciI family protein n=1 Tax=Maritimibacter sp. HL-12 TaxID=1162418 RepID=UPI000A0EEC38|nr:YciI family protein [Maritimibacter sp. HL-12]SMH41938.1 hypothetical protein SAMN05661107_1313 [Maritimibacter sp. HL-12]